MIDRTGQKFGRLTVIRCVELGRHQIAPKWECRCDCGNTVIHRYADLKDGTSRSCGCLRKELLIKRTTKHGLCKNGGGRSRLYQIWEDMRKRCRDHKRPGWKNYGGRGITICEEWDDYATFHSWAIKTGYKDDLMIDRKDNDGNYTPDNCRFVDRKVQNNNKGNHILITYRGVTKNLQQWANELGFHRGKLEHRLQLGWPIEKAFTHHKMKNQFG